MTGSAGDRAGDRAAEPERVRAGDRADVRVVIVGGGGTGAAAAYDLSQRGLQCTLFERGELTSGTTGRHHGQLHSGARYAVQDAAIARECMREVRILNRIAAGTIEMNYGLFVALTDENAVYADRFEEACREASIPTRRIPVSEAVAYEPRLNPKARLAVVVPDGTIDAYRLPLRFFGAARECGAQIRSFCRVESVERSGSRVTGVRVLDLRTRSSFVCPADVVVNAAGPWAGIVARAAGVTLPVTPAPGTMVAVKGRLTNMVISRLHPPGDGDIIVPQRGLSIIGSTQWEADDPDAVRTRTDDVRLLLERADELVPGFSGEPYHASWSAVRPLFGVSDRGGRALSRDFEVVSHAPAVSGLYSAVGGKATVLRAMAEKIADAVCRDLGLSIPCRTSDAALPSHLAFHGVPGGTS